jgi:hypothetical protein
MQYALRYVKYVSLPAWMCASNFWNPQWNQLMNMFLSFIIQKIVSQLVCDILNSTVFLHIEVE